MAWPNPANNLTLWGMLKNMEIRQFKSGTGQFATFTISTRTRKADKSWEFEYHPCVAFGKVAERLEKYFDDGTMIGAQGCLQTKQKETKDGRVFYDTSVHVTDLAFLPKGITPKEFDEAPKEAAPNPEHVTEADEDLPF